MNVNVLAEDNDEMNNEISFDSEKFSKLEKVRPRETIENLNTVFSAADVAVEADGEASNGQEKKLVNVKRLKANNVLGEDLSVSGSGQGENREGVNGNDCLLLSSSEDGSHSCHSGENSCDFSGIKRMRLDSSDKVRAIYLHLNTNSLILFFMSRRKMYSLKNNNRELLGVWSVV